MDVCLIVHSRDDENTIIRASVEPRVASPLVDTGDETCSGLFFPGGDDVTTLVVVEDRVKKCRGNGDDDDVSPPLATTRSVVKSSSNLSGGRHKAYRIQASRGDSDVSSSWARPSPHQMRSK